MRAARILAVITASLIGVTALAGCSSSDAKACDTSHPEHLGLVYGATANSMAPKLTAETSELLNRAAQSNGSVTVVTPSGTPKITGPIPLGSQAHDASICSDDQASAVSAVGVVLTKSVARTKQVDYLASIADAASVDSGSSLGVAVVGSGLQTSGTLDFSKNGLLYGDPTLIADQMAAKGELPPALKGLTVHWSGLGDVEAPQQALPVSAVTNLKAIWTAVIKKAGGRVIFLPEHLTDSTRPGLPTVTTVPVRAVALTPDWGAPVSLSDAQLHFAGGSSRLLDPAGAKVLLRKVASSITEGNIRVTVTGATSAQGGASQADDITLSKRRAATVISVLRQLGVPADLLTPEGVGHAWCGFRKEIASGGKTAAQVAAENRKVVLTAEGVKLCANA